MAFFFPSTRRRLLPIAFGVASAAAAAGIAPAQEADTILYDGVIVTADEAFMKAEAVAIRDGRFAYVGTTAGAQALRGDGTEMIDLKGHTVLPGLLDTHVHQFGGATNLVRVDLLDAKSVADIQERIAARVAETPPGEWVIASSRWHESLIEEGRLPTRWELDEGSPDNPVVIPRGGHVLTVNSRALEAAGITPETPDPEGGVIVRNEDGVPTGVLFETATQLVRRVMPDVSDEPAAELRRRLRAVQREYNGYGIVGVVEPGLNERQIEIYRQLAEAGEMTIRTHILYRYTTPDGLDRALETYRRGPMGSEMVVFDGVKYLGDGGVEGGRFYAPYEIVEGEQPDPTYRGKLLLPEREQWVGQLERIADAGWQVQSHGVGDETIDTIVQGYEAVDSRAAYDVGELRWAVMHIFAPTELALRTMSRLDILATAQDHPVLLGHNMRRYLGDARAAYAIPLRDMLEQGILVGGGTDEPVVPIDPFLSMWWMTTRGTLNGYQLGPDQAVSVRDAIRMYTANNAYIMGVEEEQGSIEVGKLADLAVISKPILSIPAAEIRTIEALMTMVGGEVVYRSEGF